jgi:hypothetical protein
MFGAFYVTATRFIVILGFQEDIVALQQVILMIE